MTAPRRIPPRERGAALLAVLVLVAVMGAMAAAAFDKLRLSTALAVNVAALDQARAYAVGIESLLALRVEDLVGESSDTTSLEGGWNGAVRRIELPGAAGVAEAALTDGGNCFNLNSLVQGEAETVLAPRPQGIAQFARLMAILGMPDEQALRIAAAAADWADSDSAPGAGGAEDSAYAGRDHAYRTANTLFAEVSELRAVAGMTPELYPRLRPWLCALPTTEPSTINVNTLLPGQAPLIAMLAPGMSLATARQVLAERPAGGWGDIGAFWRSPALRAARGLQPVAQPELSTHWFAIDIKVTVDGTELNETALVDARLRPARIALRRWTADE